MGEGDHAAITVDHVSKRFGDQYALRDVSLTALEGRTIGLIGPSGSGKTTMVRLMTGVLRPDEGSLTVLGRAPDEFDIETRVAIGYMPQQFSHYPDLTVTENLRFSASIYGVGKGRAERYERVLEMVELSDHRHKLVHQLSGGMRRRLSLAAALIHDPQLVFLDEPTAGIDPILRRKFWDYFDVLKGEGRTLFITTQYVGEAAYCDVVAVLMEGRLLAIDTPDALRRLAYGGDLVEMKTREPLSPERLAALMSESVLVGETVEREGSRLMLVVDNITDGRERLGNWGREQAVEIEWIEPRQPPFDDVFLQLVKKEEN
jgi:ABC-2 type transport system ATP-binding protein